MLEKFSPLQHVLAIGECGLDKICSISFELQQKVFSAQIELANTINKPLIIHCVRAYEEVQQLLQQHRNKVPVIFHGFNKNELLAKQLVDKGFYLSFGKSLQQTVLQQLIKNIPAVKMFFETDDADIDIAAVYAIAAGALQIDINSLSLQIQKNAAAVFGAAWF
jgi:TatD DNase family protein